MLTLTELKSSLPANLRTNVSQDLVDKLNQAAQDPEMAAVLKENIVSYTSVLAEGRFKIDDYLNAVAYVSYKLMNYSNQDSYMRAFPKRYQALVAAGRSAKEISAYVANYNKNKLVNLIIEQSLVPTWVLNQDVYQEAINTQFKLMQTSQSDKVRCEAANSILTHLKRPETKKVQIDLGVRQDTGLEALKTTMAQLAQQQIELIQQGVNTREIAHQKLVRPAILDGDAEDAEILDASEDDLEAPIQEENQEPNKDS